ncbi:MAG: DUF2232 domain-containing protein [Eubacteriales bacterium]|nr:DUF2232 domain-containing protein [Eubacteriales bacterium]
MQQQVKKKDTWGLWLTVLTPVAVLLAGVTLFGMPLIPMLCVYGDRRSKRPLGIFAAAAVCVLYALLLGVYSIVPILFLAVCTGVPYVLCGRKVELTRALAITLASCLAAAFVSFAAASLFTGRNPAGALGSFMSGQYAQSQEDSPVRVWGDSFVTMSEWMQDDKAQAQDMQKIADEVAQRPLTDRAAQIREEMSDMAATYLPALVLILGAVVGLVSYYVPVALLEMAKPKEQRTGAKLGRIWIPRYFVLAMVAAAVLTWGLYRLGWGVSRNIYLAVFVAMYMIMIVQGLLMVSFLLERTKLSRGVQLLLLLGSAALLGTLYAWAGIFETLFNLRLGISRMDYLRARGVDPSSSDAVDLIAQHDREMFGKEKKNKDEEDRK